MAVLQVLHIPDERLRKVAEPVKEVNAETQRIIDDMFDTMYAEEGIGLAATQVDIHQRIIVIDVSENREAQGDIPAVVMHYGVFIQNVFDFVIVAFAIFMAIKLINRLNRKKKEEPAAPAAPSKEEVLLTEIRDLLKAQNNRTL